jgi:hypothetical protein
MGVAVHFKPGHRWLRSRKPSVLGGGLLERVRSTTLALLGVTTAVGLAMVALALNQSWPLLADSPMPVGPPRHEAVGEATIAAQAIAGARGAGLVRLDGAAGSDSRRAGRRGDRGGAQAPESGFAPSSSAELVVTPSAPVEGQGDATRGNGDPASGPSPAGSLPQAPAPPVPVSAPAQPEPAPQAPPAVETTPPAISAEAPVSSSDDDWDDDSDWDDDDWDDDDDEWDDDDSWHGHGHGHRWSRGHHDG